MGRIDNELDMVNRATGFKKPIPFLGIVSINPSTIDSPSLSNMSGSSTPTVGNSTRPRALARWQTLRQRLLSLPNRLPDTSAEPSVTSRSMYTFGGRDMDSLKRLESAIKLLDDGYGRTLEKSKRLLGRQDELQGKVEEMIVRCEGLRGFADEKGHWKVSHRHHGLRKSLAFTCSWLRFVHPTDASTQSSTRTNAGTYQSPG